jgi:hypothetical protein
MALPVPFLQARRNQSAHFSVFALLFAETISYFQNRVDSIAELEELTAPAAWLFLTGALPKTVR